MQVHMCSGISLVRFLDQWQWLWAAVLRKNGRITTFTRCRTTFSVEGVCSATECYKQDVCTLYGEQRAIETEREIVGRDIHPWGLVLLNETSNGKFHTTNCLPSWLFWAICDMPSSTPCRHTIIRKAWKTNATRSGA